MQKKEAEINMKILACMACSAVLIRSDTWPDILLVLQFKSLTRPFDENNSDPGIEYATGFYPTTGIISA